VATVGNPSHVCPVRPRRAGAQPVAGRAPSRPAEAFDGRQRLIDVVDVDRDDRPGDLTPTVEDPAVDEPGSSGPCSPLGPVLTSV